MKRGWKIFWIVCGVLIVFGIACCAVGAAMGGNVASIKSDMFEQHKEISIVEENVIDVNPIVIPEESADDTTETEYKGIRKVDAEVSYIELQVVEYEGETVKVQTSGISQELLQDISCQSNGDELKIEQEHHKRWEQAFYNADEDYGVMVIWVPENSLEEADLSVGAGLLYVENIQAKELDVEVGAGKAIVESFTTEHLSLQCGAGEAEIGGDAKQSEIECGMGSVSYNAAGKETDYNYELECGVGSLNVGSMSLAGVASEKRLQNPGAARQMDIQCGLGSVEVTFNGEL